MLSLTVLLNPAGSLLAPHRHQDGCCGAAWACSMGRAVLLEVLGLHGSVLECLHSVPFL